MAAEMAEQPDVIAALVGRRDQVVDSIRSLVGDRPPVGTVMIARGSSDFAAIYGRYVIEAACGRPVSLAAPSLHTLYDVRSDHDGYLAVAVSQSGQTPEIVTVAQRIGATGGRTIAVTNDPDSPLAQIADRVVDLGAGEERAVPATKTFTSSLLAFALVAEALGDVPWSDDDLEALPGHVATIVEDREPPERVARTIDSGEGLVVVGRGYMFPVALEAAIKLKETTSLLAEGFSAADLRHGPVAIVHRDLPVLAYHVPGPARADMLDLVDMLRTEHDAHVLVATSDDGADLPLPEGVPEALAPIPAAVRGQQIAHALALLRGVDPDAPPHLRKVTATR
jgi:glutamine---fructose-6-phosphate transaminase (isomerizing)